MRNSKIQWLVEAGIMIALAQILSYIKVAELPSGGSVTAGSMVPILFFAFRWGLKKGILVGIAYGVLQFMLGTKYSFHPISILCDYIFAFGALGLGGLLRGSMFRSMLSCVIALSARLVFHLISGVVIFGSLAPEGVSPLNYSLGYNLSYMVPELGITLLFVLFLYKPVIKAGEQPNIS